LILASSQQALVDGVTHVTINKTSALERLPPPLTTQGVLRSGASIVAKHFLCDLCLAAFHRDVVRQLRLSFKLGLLLDDDARFDTFLETVNTTDLVEFLSYDEKRHESLVRAPAALETVKYAGRHERHRRQ